MTIATIALTLSITAGVLFLPISLLQRLMGRLFQ